MVLPLGGNILLAIPDSSRLRRREQSGGCVVAGELCAADTSRRPHWTRRGGLLPQQLLVCTTSSIRFVKGPHYYNNKLPVQQAMRFMRPSSRYFPARQANGGARLESDTSFEYLSISVCLCELSNAPF